MVLYKLQNTAILMLCVATLLRAKLECDPSDPTRQLDPASNGSYFYCSLQGKLVKTHCAYGRTFNSTTLKCSSKNEGKLRSEFDDPLAKPHRQATSVCGSGSPWLQNGSPVSCNPQVSSCPQGYKCQLYANAGLYFCCSGGTPQQLGCPNDFTAYIEANTNQPRACTPPPSANSCPTGFGCVLAGGVRYQCCGRSFGCPYNTAAYINFQTANYQTCQFAGQVSGCPNGYLCQQSSQLNRLICCTNIGGSVSQCPNGGSPLVTNGVLYVCSAATPCPTGNYACTFVNGQNVCCPSAVSTICPAGTPLSGVTCSTTLPCASGYDCVTNAGTNYCCPNEVSVCSQPLSTGTQCGQTPQNRYYFNTGTGQCSVFSYSGCGGGSNNFLDLSRCENFCHARMCRYGRPLRSGNTNQVCVQNANTCPATHSCQQPLFGPVNVYLCCPTAATACNQAMQTGTQCYGATTSILRFYYNLQTKSCNQFTYYGCAGNSNNFRSATECNNFCARSICVAGVPLTDPSGNPQVCSSALPCQANYQCTASGTQSYCCPSATIVCSQPVNQGSVCTVTIPQRQMYYYNPSSRTCSPFTFLGCGGNSNRFESTTTCQSFCATAVQGTCPGGLTPIYIAGTTVPRTCTINVPSTCTTGSNCMLSTSGQPICCQGTPNCPGGYTPYYLPGTAQTVACNTATSCPASYTCVASSNINNMNLCCRSTSSICPNNLPSNNQACTINAVNGCPTNYLCLSTTPTSTAGSCCQATAQCRVGSTPYYIPGSTNQVQICSGGHGGCPSGTVCQTSTITGVSICCNNAATIRCPNGQQPYIPVGSSVPQQCALGTSACPTNYACQAGTTGTMVCCYVQTSALCANGRVPYYPPGQTTPQICYQMQPNCQSGYSCQASTVAGQYYCCPGNSGGNTNAAKCPTSQLPYLMAGLPLACPAGSPNCPKGYCCVQSNTYGQYLCCSCSSNAYANCANGQVPYIIPGTTQRQICNPLQSLCPTQYSCEQSTVVNTNICCKSSVVNKYCPAGQKPLLQSNGLPLECFPDVPKNCAFGHKCTYESERRKYYCCKSVVPNESYCPSGRQPYILSGQSIPRTCHTTLNPCPSNYACQYSATLRQSYCCSVGNVIDGCPSGSRPLIVGSQVRTCVATNNPACPTAYQCLFSIPFQRWQCCTYNALARSQARKRTQCVAGEVAIAGRCLRLMLPGENGCTYSEQCNLSVPGTACSAGYCVCPANKLVLRTQCVTYCPTGYINAVGRCTLLINMPFLSEDAMEELSDSTNGTVGGWCLNTVIKEQQCNVANAECGKMLRCQCAEGSELKVINQEQTCVQLIESNKLFEEGDKNEEEEKDEVKRKNETSIEDLEKRLFEQKIID